MIYARAKIFCFCILITAICLPDKLFAADINDKKSQPVSAKSAGSPASETAKCFRRQGLHDAVILLMRHAEKTYNPGDRDLSATGFARAKALADYIPEHFKRRPDFLFATADSPKSSRPRETLEPLSRKLGLSIDASISNDNYKELAKQLDNPRFAGKFIVIAWHHGRIPPLAAELGAPDGSYPNPWDGKVFNEIIELDYDAEGRAVVKEVFEDLELPAVGRL